jgi:hypothetical protein
MKISLGIISDDPGPGRLQRLLRDIERAFDRLPVLFRQGYEVTLDFSAPGAVPGYTEETVTIEGVEFGDTVIVGAPNARPTGFIGPFAEVSAADTVTVYWVQLSGAAADPDGAGGTYRIDVWRH